MLGLILDTSSSYTLVALAQNDTLSHEFLSSNSKEIFPLLCSIEEKTPYSLDDLDYIAFGRGPGSYTGIRAGAAAAKGLSFSLDIPLIPFCSLLAYLPHTHGRCAGVMEGKGDNSYLIIVNFSTASIEFEGLLPHTALPEKLSLIETVYHLPGKPHSSSLLPFLPLLISAPPRQGELLYLTTPTQIDHVG